MQLRTLSRSSFNEVFEAKNIEKLWIKISSSHNVTLLYSIWMVGVISLSLHWSGFSELERLISLCDDNNFSFYLFLNIVWYKEHTHKGTPMTCSKLPWALWNYLIRKAWVCMPWCCLDHSMVPWTAIINENGTEEGGQRGKTEQKKININLYY